MIETISEFIVDLFQDNVVLATMFISMIPLFELKVGIPFGMNSDFWIKPLAAWPALFSAIAGGFIVTIILAIIFKPIYEKVKDKKFFKSFISFFTSSALKKSEEVNQKTEQEQSKNKLWIKLLSVFLFVAIPVPGTGVYTGTVLAVFLGLNFWQTVLMVTVGNVLAGIIIMFICAIFPSFTTIIIYIFVSIILVYLIYRLIVHFINKKNNKNKAEVEAQEIKNTEKN